MHTDALPLSRPEGLLWLIGAYGATHVVAWILRETNAEISRRDPESIHLGVLFSVAVLFLGVWRLRNCGPLSLIGITTNKLWPDVLLTLKWCGVMAVVYGLFLAGFYAWCHHYAEGEHTFGEFVRQSAFDRNNLRDILPVVLAFPIIEEFWFRGVVYTAIRRDHSRARTMLLTAALFASAHMGSTAVPINQFLGGLVFAWLYERTQRLTAPILLHMAGNGSLALFGHIVTRNHWLGA